MRGTWSMAAATVLLAGCPAGPKTVPVVPEPAHPGVVPTGHPQDPATRRVVYNEDTRPGVRFGSPPVTGTTIVDYAAAPAVIRGMIQASGEARTFVGEGPVAASLVRWVRENVPTFPVQVPERLWESIIYTPTGILVRANAAGEAVAEVALRRDFFNRDAWSGATDVTLVLAYDEAGGGRWLPVEELIPESQPDAVVDELAFGLRLVNPAEWERRYRLPEPPPPAVADAVGEPAGGPEMAAEAAGEQAVEEPEEAPAAPAPLP